MSRYTILAAVVSASSLVARSAGADPLPPSTPPDPSLETPPAPAATVGTTAPPPVATAPARPPRPKVHIRFEPETADIALLRRTREAPKAEIYEFRDVRYYTTTVRYVRICQGPCDVELPVGHYDLALAKADGDTVPASTELLSAPATIHALYTDRSTLRHVGLGVGVVGALGGLGMIIAGAADTRATTASTPLFIAGVATIVGAAALGMIIGLRDDGATVQLTPLVLPPPPGATSAAPPAPSASLQGAALTVAF